MNAQRFLLAWLVLVAHTTAGAPLPQELGSTTRVYSTLASFAELRDKNLVRQGRDFSCGAAALATLLTYHWRDPVSEDDVLRSLARIISENEMAARSNSGFSLFDLQRVARSLGYRAQGFRMSSQQLDKLKGPVIVFIKPDGYKHFAVLRGLAGDRVILADPSRGNITVPRYRFLDWWQDKQGEGIIFAAEPIRPGVEKGKNAMAWQGQDAPLIDMRSLLPDAALAAPARLLGR